MTSLVNQHLTRTVALLGCVSAFSARLLAAPFFNLDFESVRIDRVLASGGSPSTVDALPGWTVSFGDREVPEVLYNNFSQTTVSATLWDAGPFVESRLQGRFYFLMTPGRDPITSTYAMTSIYQRGDIPSDAASVRFLALSSPDDRTLQLSIGGEVLPVVQLEQRTFSTLYGANLGGWAGRTAELRFSTILVPGELSGMHLDAISFSPIAVVPEPGVLTLAGLGSLALLASLLRKPA